MSLRSLTEFNFFDFGIWQWMGICKPFVLAFGFVWFDLLLVWFQYNRKEVLLDFFCLKIYRLTEFGGLGLSGWYLKVWHLPLFNFCCFLLDFLLCIRFAATCISILDRW